MEINISNRKSNINTVVLLAVVYGAVTITSLFPQWQTKIWVQAVAVVTSKGVYELIIYLIYFMINRFKFAMRIYWGDLYLRGIWSYEYEIEGKIYFGVWDIRQDINGLSLIGNGLDENFRMRTIVRSVSPLIGESGGYFFINQRNEMANQNAQVFSKTTLLLDHPTGLWGRCVKSMRGITQVYGGPSDKQLHPNVVFRKHTDVGSIEALIEKLKIMSSEKVLQKARRKQRSQTSTKVSG